MEESYFRVFRQNSGRIHPLSIPRFMGSGPASAISQSFGITGPALCTSSACASSAHAIAEAAWYIRSGRAKAVIAGGTEASLTYGGVLGWQSLGALARDTCRPFSIGRTGMVPAEGAAALVLENYDQARERGAQIYGEVVGCGYSSDAFHLTQPKTEGAIRAMSPALTESALPSDTRFLISTHGTGTQLNDSSEAAALNTLFAADLDRHLAIATKSSHGHMIGATGAIELLIGLLALKNRTAPPVCNFLGPDPSLRVAACGWRTAGIPQRGAAFQFLCVRRPQLRAGDVRRLVAAALVGNSGHCRNSAMGSTAEGISRPRLTQFRSRKMPPAGLIWHLWVRKNSGTELSSI